MKSFLRYFVGTFSLFLACFWFVSEVSADDYDFYVDIDTNGSEDGSEDNPYDTISEAIEDADDEDEIYIKEGDYDEDLTIDKELFFFGEDLEDVVINGTITISENVEAEDFTVSGNIIVKSGADVIFDNLTIEDADQIAIDAYSGNGEIIVKNSIIKDAGGKGFYIQKGRDIIISSCEVYDNEEEGVDLRSNVDGTISGNSIYDNGESGIELIVSDSSLNIKNNVIKNNGSSGIAGQYYDDFDEEGEINITGNTITGNDKYGFDCANPQGGDWDSDFWTNSISFSSNTFSGNDKEDINDDCGFNEVATTSKEATEAQSEAQKEAREIKVAEVEQENEIQEKIIEQNRQKTVQSNEYNLNKLVAAKKELKDEVLLEKEKIEGRNGLVSFLIGPNYGAINNIKEVASGFGEYLSDFDDLDRKLIEDSNHTIAETEMEDIVNFAEEVNSLIVEKDSKFSLFGWVFRIFI